MFLHYLSENQKKSFLSLARQFIQIDSRLAPQEEEMLDAMQAETGISLADEPAESDINKLLQVFDSRRAKISLLLEIIGLGYSDQDFDPKESAFILDISEKLGIASPEITKLENWVNRQLTLGRELAIFFEE